MSAEKETRRLAAIVSADVAGYSRLMAEDESATLAALRSHRKELVEPAIARHGGRMVKLMGDGALVEFPSVVDAVQFSVDVQRAMAQREAEVSEDRRHRFRFGVNVGEVVIDGEDIYGDGVNVAARLQELAQPGGICVSGRVYSDVRGKLDVGFTDLGEQSLKNIPEPVRAYGVLLDGEAELPPLGPPAARRRPVVAWMAAVAALLAIAAVGAGLWWWQPWQQAGQVTGQAILSIPDKPSIAVLPFQNLSEDMAQDYFADGMAEDLITDLSKISGLFVIARNSSFQYKDKAVDVRQVARELGVRYVLEGSVRRVGEQVRINAQLIDATTGGHLWAERYDGSLNDIFSLQDTVTRNVVSALAVSLKPAEQVDRGRPTTVNAEAYDAYLRGWAHYRRSTPDDFAKAVPHFERALELEPDYNRAHAALAALYSTLPERNWSTGTSVWSMALDITMAEGLARERQHLEQALKDPVPLAHIVASRRATRQGRHDEAILAAERAAAADPNEPLAHHAMGNALVYAGHPREALQPLNLAMRLDPGFQHEYLFSLGLAQFSLQLYEDAADTLTESARANPEDDRSLIVLAAAYGQLGKTEEAKAAIDKANQIRIDQQQRLPQSKIEIGVDSLLLGPYTLEDVDFWPFKEQADRARLREGLRLAGMPEVGEGNKVSPLEVPGATTVDPTEAKRLHEAGVPFVDVRPEALWANGYIPGAINLDLKTAFNEAALLRVVSKDDPVVFYCMGPRCLVSSKACAQAVAWGFRKVYYLREGFPGWQAAGFPIEIR